MMQLIVDNQGNQVYEWVKDVQDENSYTSDSNNLKII